MEKNYGLVVKRGTLVKREDREGESGSGSPEPGQGKEGRGLRQTKRGGQ